MIPATIALVWFALGSLVFGWAAGEFVAMWVKHGEGWQLAVIMGTAATACSLCSLAALRHLYRKRRMKVLSTGA